MSKYEIKTEKYYMNGPPLRVYVDDRDNQFDDAEINELINKLKFHGAHPAEILKAITKLIGEVRAKKLCKIVDPNEDEPGDEDRVIVADPFAKKPQDPGNNDDSEPR